MKDEWVLRYLSDWHRRHPQTQSGISMHEFWDEGLEFIDAYAAHIGTRDEPAQKVRRSLIGRLRRMEAKGLVRRDVVSNKGWSSFDGPPTSTVGFMLTPEGEAAAEASR